MPDGYDQMQVCLNGHRITDMARRFPHFRKAFCPACGARTIDSCDRCNAPIPGHCHMSNVFSTRTTPVPKYCACCGEAFPWQRAGIENAIETIRESGLTSQDLQEFELALPDIVRETPKTQSASMKARRLLSKLAKPVYDITVHVITDVASETAKKTLRL